MAPRGAISEVSSLRRTIEDALGTPGEAAPVEHAPEDEDEDEDASTG